VVQATVAVGVELEDRLRGVLDLLGVEFLIVVRVEHFAERVGRRPEVTVVRPSGWATRSAAKIPRSARGRATRRPLPFRRLR
jgi:hypothetical protein